MPFGAALGLASLGGGLASLFGAGGASRAEQNGLQQEIGLGQGQISQNNANFSPFIGLGQNAANLESSLLPSLSQSFNPTVAQLQATPGYQFELTQGSNATNNALAAQGLSGSGAELSALDAYNTGLANNTYQSLANIYNQNRQTTAGLLNSAQGIGEGAAGTEGSLNNQLIGQIGGAQANKGLAQAGGILGGANALSGLLGNEAGILGIPSDQSGTLGGELGNGLSSLFGGGQPSNSSQYAIANGGFLPY